MPAPHADDGHRHAREDELAAVPAPRPGLRALASKLLPWISLAVGVAGAILMDRGPRRAWLVAGAAVLVWLVLVVLQWLARAGEEEHGRVSLAMLRGARLLSLVASQSLVQLTLFFALPFFVRAATWDIGHALFLLGLGALSLASLWDPLTEWLLHRPGLAAILPATGSFAALTAVLPGLGLSTRASLWIAALVATAGVPVLIAAQAPPQRRRRAALLGLGVALLLPVSLALGAARVVPAAPLRLVKGEIGTQRAGKWVADSVSHLDTPPERLICATAVYAPLGLRDELFHVWRKNGKPRARVHLGIVGGRAQGYRTQSRISGIGEHDRGRFSCRVETESGQVLGTRHVTIGSGER